MTPQALSILHQAAFRNDRPWQADEFQSLLDSPFVTLFHQPYGFALTRTLAGESELLTLAVDPRHQRRGIARALLCDWLDDLEGQASEAFLEVAADNLAACALYQDLGFAQIAIRAGYYARPTGPNVDALIFKQALTHGHGAESEGSTSEFG